MHTLASQLTVSFATVFDQICNSRSEDELDAVTLHNQALMNMDSKPTEGFEKLQFLLQQNPFPPETFGNLLLLYCKYEYYDLAADVLAENAHLTYK